MDVPLYAVLQQYDNDQLEAEQERLRTALDRLDAVPKAVRTAADEPAIGAKLHALVMITELRLERGMLAPG